MRIKEKALYKTELGAMYCADSLTLMKSLPDDSIEIGEAFAPVVRISLRNDVLTSLVFDELKRACSYRRGVCRILQWIGSLIDVARGHISQIAKRPQQKIQRHRA